MPGNMQVWSFLLHILLFIHVLHTCFNAPMQTNVKCRPSLPASFSRRLGGGACGACHCHLQLVSRTPLSLRIGRTSRLCLQVWLKQLATPLFNSGSRQTIEDMSLREFADACKPHFQTSSNSDWNAGGGLLGSYFAMLSAQVSALTVSALAPCLDCCSVGLFLAERCCNTGAALVVA